MFGYYDFATRAVLAGMAIPTPFAIVTVILPALAAEGLTLAGRDEPCRPWRGPDGRLYFVLDTSLAPAKVGS